MPTSATELYERRAVSIHLVFILIVMVPGWIMTRYLYEMSIVPVLFAVQIDFSALALFGFIGFFLAVREYRAAARADSSIPNGILLQNAVARLMVFAAFSQAVSGYVQGLYVAGRWLVRDVLPNLPPLNASLVGIAATLLVGTGLFVLRLKARSLYATLEILTALAVAAHLAPKFTVTDPLNLEFYLAFVPAAVYLFVRGADNVHYSIIKAKEDLFLKSVMAVVKAFQKRWPANKKQN